jgi:hypothetical protein
VYWVALELPWFWCHSECGVEGHGLFIPLLE